MSKPASAGRLPDIDVGKGIAIFLVVAGHIVARDYVPQGNDWWALAHVRLYSFHMAFFFFLTGYVYFLTDPVDWWERLRRSANRLIPTYVLFAVLVYVAKSVAVHVLPVDRNVGGILEEAWLMLKYPTDGFASFLWFIVTLLSMYGLMALLAPLIRRFYVVVLIASLALHLASVTGNVTELFALHQLARYWFYFMLGGLCLQHRAVLLSMFREYTLYWTLAFVLVLSLIPDVWLPTAAACLSIPALHGIAANVYRVPRLEVALQWLGRNSFTIFLMNSLALGLARGIVLRVWTWDDWRFFVVAPLLTICGLLLPIAAQRLFFARWRFLDRITR